MTGVSLLTVVMHELGHLLGYEHGDDPDDLMAPVLSPSSPRSSSLIPDPSSLILHPFSHVDEVFGESDGDARVEDSSLSGLLESKAEGLSAATTARRDEESMPARVPRRNRLQRYERELDEWFAELALEDVGE